MRVVVYWEEEDIWHGREVMEEDNGIPRFIKQTPNKGWSLTNSEGVDTYYSKPTKAHLCDLLSNLEYLPKELWGYRFKEFNT